MSEGIKYTNFSFPDQTGKYVGKVRDVYMFDDKLVMVASDRISAFDVVLPRSIPYKGQVLNQVAARFLTATRDIVPNWVLEVPDPNVTIGLKCEPFRIEMVIRGYLVGHAWREYNLGKRTLCGVAISDGMKESDKFPTPIITPATKADEGHDEDISKEDIISKGIVSAEDYKQLENFTYQLFERGTEMARQQGLILVDTKYEFGKRDGKIYLIDEIHTPDSSRYFYLDTYDDLQRRGEPQRQLSKEFVRRWLIENNFQGKEGQTIPEMTDDFVNTISDRYIELYEKVCGEPFQKGNQQDILERIEKNITKAI